MSDEGTKPDEGTEPEEAPAQKAEMHPAERRKYETALKELKELKAKHAELENAGKSELDKLRSELERVKPAAERLQKYDEALQAEVEADLEGLTKEQRKQISPLLERLDDPLTKRMALKTLLAQQPKDVPSPTVNRQAPAKPVAGLPRSMAEFQSGSREQQKAWTALSIKEGVDLALLPVT